MGKNIVIGMKLLNKNQIIINLSRFHHFTQKLDTPWLEHYWDG
jgi:hypothetical protein